MTMTWTRVSPGHYDSVGGKENYHIDVCDTNMSRYDLFQEMQFGQYDEPSWESIGCYPSQRDARQAAEEADSRWGDLVRDAGKKGATFCGQCQYTSESGAARCPHCGGVMQPAPAKPEVYRASKTASGVTVERIDGPTSTGDYRNELAAAAKAHNARGSRYSFADRILKEYSRWSYEEVNSRLYLGRVDGELLGCAYTYGGEGDRSNFIDGIGTLETGQGVGAAILAQIRADSPNGVSGSAEPGSEGFWEGQGLLGENGKSISGSLSSSVSAKGDEAGYVLVAYDRPRRNTLGNRWTEYRYHKVTCPALKHLSRNEATVVHVGDRVQHSNTGMCGRCGASSYDVQSAVAL